MERSTIQATKRQELGSRASRRLRAEGLVPAVLYGHQRDTVHLTVPLRDLERMVHDGARMTDLEIGGTVETALLKDIQYDAMGDHILHIDLARVDLNEQVTVAVPVELHGLAKGAASGGTLDHVLQDLQVECLVTDIPEKVRIEVAELDIGDIIHVRDLEPPQGVRFLQDPDALVVTVHPPVAAPVEEAPVEEEEAPAGEPEVLTTRREKEEQADQDAKNE